MQKLLLREEDKLGHYSPEHLARIDQQMARNQQLIDKQRVLVVRYNDTGGRSRAAGELLETLVQTQSLFEHCRARIQRGVVCEMPVELSQWNHDRLDAESPINMNGLHILLAEDAWQIGEGLKGLLQSIGAKVAGPAATMAEVDHLLAERTPHAAIIDLTLRGGERADGLIDRLSNLGVSIIVASGYD